jgi:hypothetical protein
MPSSNWADEVDTNKLAETALAILSLTLHDDGRVWKGLDWDLMDLLHERGWVGESPQTTTSTAHRSLSQPWNPLSNHLKHERRSGAVLYAKDVGRVVAFYSAVLDVQASDGDENHVVLESPSFQLVVLRIPEDIASSIEITIPPTRRAKAAIKPVFFVPSIAPVRATAEAFGGVLNSSDKEWSFQGFTVCDVSILKETSFSSASQPANTNGAGAGR